MAKVAAGRRAVDLPLPACDSNDRLTLSASWLPIPMPDGHVVAMTDAEFQWLASSDPRLAAYAASRLPAWLWTADGTRILWANAAGARLFGAASAAALAEKTFGPADRHRRQVARLAGRLLAGGAIRLERLQGFGAALGGLSTCGCSRFDFPDGSHGVLIAAGNIALITPRPAQPQFNNEMPPSAPSSEPPLSEPVLSEPVVQPGAPACLSSNRSRRNRLPIISSRHIRRSARRVCAVRCVCRTCRSR